MSVIALSVAVLAAWLTVIANAQIPTVCADQNSLENSICCPVTADGICSNRGSCVTLDLQDYDDESSHVRGNWPHYYTQVCHCYGRFTGYDCSRCKFGYYGYNCQDFQVLPRPPARDLSDEDWTDFIELLNLAKTYSSGYSAVLEESLPGNASISTTPLTIYDYYVWIHHYVTKDAINPDHPVDYAHDGPGFFTWHRLLNLHLEWQLQDILHKLGRDDYYNFRLPYWDWRTEFQRSPIGLSAEELFTEGKLGVTRNTDGYPRVFGDNYDGYHWQTLCWQQLGQICDPRETTGPLQRCPPTETDPNPCRSSNPDWPAHLDVLEALAIEAYDEPNYNSTTVDGFRSFIDANISIRPHIITGVGDLANKLVLPVDKHGHMSDYAAPSNDPLFILHTTMLDCIFQDWMPHIMAQSTL